VGIWIGGVAQLKGAQRERATWECRSDVAERILSSLVVTVAVR